MLFFIWLLLVVRRHKNLLPGGTMKIKVENRWNRVLSPLHRWPFLQNGSALAYSSKIHYFYSPDPAQPQASKNSIVKLDHVLHSHPIFSVTIYTKFDTFSQSHAHTCQHISIVPFKGTLKRANVRKPLYRVSHRRTSWLQLLQGNR